MDVIYNIEPIVSVEWLNNNLDATNLVILDATIPKVTNKTDSVSEGVQIINAKFFDIKKKFSDIKAPFPSTFPSEEQFTKEAQLLGINKDSVIVVYDDKGIYSSARAWWLFKSFGHNNVAVLNGGFPEWKKQGFQLECKQIHKTETGNFVGKLQAGTMLFFDDIIKLQNEDQFTILDARSKDRFDSLISEPREGLRSGNIPNSINLPFTDLLRDGKLLLKDDLEKVFKRITKEESNLVFSCGSGITACVLALGAHILGYKRISVYDGSWTEYGSLIPYENLSHWTKEELIAYTLLYAVNSNHIESNLERNVIIETVDMATFEKIHNEFDKDNDYQSISKIIQGLKEHHYTSDDIEALLAEVKVLFFADGEFDVTERIMYRSLKKILS